MRCIDSTIYHSNSDALSSRSKLRVSHAEKGQMPLRITYVISDSDAGNQYLCANNEYEPEREQANP
ncbi:hypothetical protein Vau01_094510 [Virgisporangium aurantiacum]|uniref:Uncharacterized protein n=1 Tax=Virgisporangium aurantiacum TaxID=175570 RepID=A0A8J3ZHE0_9ACTN|nr:hypothetical protein Vau01_094510 [Virgisporangium aurantiacum]